jgi:multidrug resistance efflux pump
MKMEPRRAVVSTPWPLRVRRFRYQVLPIVAFVAAAVTAGWLWTLQTQSSSGVGEVQQIRVDVDAKFDGVLLSPSLPAVFDSVRADQLLVRIDTAAQQAELARLEQELDRDRTPTPLNQWHLARIAELREQIRNADYKAPIDGTITRINARGGEYVALGEPILTIFSDRADFITGYLRPGQTVRPLPGMAVEVKSRSPLTQSFRSWVQSVGAGYEPLPPHLQFNPNIPERVLTIQIALPEGTHLMPGEAVDFTLRPDEQKSSAFAKP